MQPMMGMPGMQMGMAQQMAAMPQMAMAPMAMGTPMGMMPVMQMGVPMMPMGMMGINPMNQPMMMVPGAQMPTAAGMAPMPPPDLSATGSLAPMSLPDPGSQPTPSSASRQARRRREEDDSDEEGRGIQALRNVGSAISQSKEGKRGLSSEQTTATESGGAEASRPPPAPSEPVEKKRCHLHSKKPNPSCKVCRRIKEAEENDAKESSADQSSKAVAKEPADKDDSSRREKDKDEARLTFSCSPMLKDQILKSSYFKSLLDITTVEGLIEEIHQYADNMEVYNPGSATMPSCFICQVYRLFTLPHAEEDIQIVLYSESAIVRCVGFVYIRLVFDPAQLWGMLEEYLFDDMEIRYADGGKQSSTTIGEYVEALLIKEKYYGTPLPRIPVKVKQQIEERLAPLPSYRKRMQANKRVFENRERIRDMPVEVCVDGQWLPGKVLELVGSSSTFVRVKVRLEDGHDTTSHLGKVVLRDRSPERSGSESSGGRSGSEGGGRNRRKKQRRSRSRRRGRSPDWSRWKGKSHSEMLEELRERAREDAVCGYGKVYPKRPLTFEGFATKYEASEHRTVDRDVPSHGHSRGGSSAQKHEDADDDITKRLKIKQEEERLRNQRAIFEKYSSKSRPGGSDASSAYNDVDRLDVLRLG